MSNIEEQLKMLINYDSNSNEEKKNLSQLSFEELLKIQNKSENNNISQEENKSNILSRKAKKRMKRNKLKQNLSLSLPIMKMPSVNVPRDPRFDPLCGQFNKKIHKSNYKFIHELRKIERIQLENNLKNITDPDDRQKIKFDIQRLDNQIREQERLDKVDKEIYEEKKQRREKLLNGKKPEFKKKSVRKLEGLINKYEELKKSNKLQKHIEKRSKKLITRDRKKLDNFFLNK